MGEVNLSVIAKSHNMNICYTNAIRIQNKRYLCHTEESITSYHLVKNQSVDSLNIVVQPSLKSTWSLCLQLTY